MSPRVVLGFIHQFVDVPLLEILGQVFHLITGFGRVLGERVLTLLLQLLARLIQRLSQALQALGGLLLLRRQAGSGLCLCLVHQLTRLLLALAPASNA